MFCEWWIAKAVEEVVSVYFNQIFSLEGTEENHEKPQSEQSGLQAIQPPYSVH